MRTALTTIIILFGIVTHAAHLAPWNPDGDGTRVGMSASGGGVVLCRTTVDSFDSFSYDLVGNLLSSSNAVAMETFSYDLAGRLVAVRDWLGHEWTFSWDGAIRTSLCYNVPCSAVSERANDNGELILKQGVLNV